MTSSVTLDAWAWVRRWERQQARYVPDRDATFSLMFDILDRLGAVPGRLVDLGCGPGSIAARALHRWPSAEVLAVDLDPVLVELGRRTLGERVRWLETDLRQAGWSRLFEPVDAVLTATALHWLDHEHVRHLARELASLMRPGAVFANYDTMPLEDTTPRLRDLSHDLRLALVDTSEADDWTGWWAGLRAEAELAPLFAERDKRFAGGSHNPTTRAAFTTALREAGFREVATIKQVANRHLLVAIR